MSEPILFAGTMKMYSMKATPHDSRMIRMSGQSVEMCISLSFSCPYQAKVIKTLEMIKRTIVQIP